MPRLLKTLLSLLFCFVLLLNFSKLASAQTNQENPTTQPRIVYQSNFIKALQAPGANSQKFIGGGDGLVSSLSNTLVTAIAGAYDEQGNLIALGAAPATAMASASLYQKPASSVQYLAYVFKNARLAPPVFAQRGQGWDFLTNTSSFGGNQPIIQLWQIARNAAYVIFIVIFVLIGFMIMFRSKLNPQTIIGVQQALPSIIISLILVTFSYAICGLIIDTVYLGHGLIDQLYFKSDPLIAVSSNYLTDVRSLDILGNLITPVAGGGSAWSGIDIVTQLGSFIQNLGGMLFDLLCALPWISSSARCAGGGAAAIFTGMLPLIFAFTLLGTSIKIFFALITKYVTLILSTIFSPYTFLIGSLPGSQTVITNFLKTMLSAALTFPAIAFMYYLASFFVGETYKLTLQPLPPLNKTGILAGAMGGAGVAFTRSLEPLVGLGLLMAAAQIPAAIDKMLKVDAGIGGAAAPEIGGALRKIPVIGSFLG